MSCAATAEPRAEERTRKRLSVLLLLDAVLVRLARGFYALDVLVGEALRKLMAGDRLTDLGFSNVKDYLHEAAGMPLSDFYEHLQLAAFLEERPILRRAVIEGRVTPRKARLVAPLALGDDEEKWVSAAERLSEAKLAELFAAEGKEARLDEFKVERRSVPMTQAEQTILDAAIEMARWVIGFSAPRWVCLEAIAFEWLGSHSANRTDPDAEGTGERLDPRPSAEGLGDGPAPKPRSEEPPLTERDVRWLVEAYFQHLSKNDRLAARILEAMAAAEKGPGGGIVPEGLSGLRLSRALHERIVELLDLRRKWDEPFGRLLKLARDQDIWSAAGFPNFAEYCRQRLGLSERAVRKRVWLEGKLEEMKPLRTALLNGRLSYSKALEVARHATPWDVKERIRQAERTTWQETARKAEQESDAKDRTERKRRLWAPAEVFGTIDLALESAKRWGAEHFRKPVGDGTAYAFLGLHFLSAWKVHVARKKRNMGPKRRRIFARKYGLCAVPGCSFAAQHVHHIRFRSHQGSDEEWNCVATCQVHHLRGVHAGRLKVVGRAGEGLVWEFAPGEGEPLWEWITEGDADERAGRRTGSERRAAPIG